MVKIGGLLEEDDTVADAGERDGRREADGTRAYYDTLQRKRRLHTRHRFLRAFGPGHQHRDSSPRVW